MKLIYPRLPEGYAELEYLEATGTQYIDTGIKAGGTISFHLESYGGFSHDAGNTRNGARDGANTNALTIVSVGGNIFRFDYGNTQIELADKDARNISFDASTATLSIEYMDGTSDTQTLTSQSFTSQYNFGLFALVSSSFVYANSQKLAFAKLWQSGTLIRHFVPAQRNADSALGMYDLVNDVFYTNAGTGVFTAGPKVHFVKGVWEILHINLWDEKTRAGYYNSSGEFVSSHGYIANKDPIYVTAGEDYYFYFGITGGSYRVTCFDSNGDMVSRFSVWNESEEFTAPEGCVSIGFHSLQSTYENNICVNKSDPAINGHYYPYAKAIKRLATAGRTFWQKLPSAYRPVKYLESTGTQYIDTGVKPTAQTKVFARLRLNSSDNNVGLFGAWQAETNSRWNLWTFTGYPNTTTFGYGEKNGSGTYLPFAVGQMLDVACYVEDGEVYWRTGEEEAHYPAGAFVEPNLNMYLFTRNRNGEAQNPAKLRCEKFTVYQGTSLVRLMLPVVRVSDSKPGMYDVVNDVFYTNAGTGEFIAGND